MCELACSAELIVFDNGVGGSSGLTEAIVSDFDFSIDNPIIPIRTAFSAFDDFVVDHATTITGVHWTGVFLSYTVPDAIPDTDNVTIEFYADAAGIPDTTVRLARFQLGSSVVRNESTQRLHDWTIFEFSATIDGFLVSPSETYWLSIRNDTFDSLSDFFWGFDELPNANAHYRYINHFQNEVVEPVFIPLRPVGTFAGLDFRLTTTVPESASFVGPLESSRRDL